MVIIMYANINLKITSRIIWAILNSVHMYINVLLGVGIGDFEESRELSLLSTETR